MHALLDQTRDPVVPTQSDALIAREAVPRLESVAEADVDIRIRVLDGPAEVIVPLPAVAVKLIVGLLAAMADGKPVSIIPSDAELTTQQAADMLNVSRPHLVKLLNDDQIAYSKVGTHRRVKVADILAYKHRSRFESHAALDDMVALSQDLGLDGGCDLDLHGPVRCQRVLRSSAAKPRRGTIDDGAVSRPLDERHP